MEYNGIEKAFLLFKAVGTGDLVPLPSVQVGYGPYSSMSDARSVLSEIFDGVDGIPQGYTFCVIEDGKPVEYWLTKEGSWTVERKNSITNTSIDNAGSDVSGAVRLANNGGYIKVSYDGGTTWYNLISVAELKGTSGSPGKDGRDVDLQNLQLRLVFRTVEDPTSHESVQQQVLQISRTGINGIYSDVGIIAGSAGGVGSGGAVPGIATYTDGNQYWTLTLDGATSWLLDDQGHMVRANGRDGTDGLDGAGIATQYKAIIFKRQGHSDEDRPETPTGGTYDNPTPTSEGWSDGVPQTDALGNADALLWMSTRWFSTNEAINDANTWSTPQRATDTADMDFEYCNAPLNTTPAAPSAGTMYDATTNPNGWYDADVYPALLANANWMAMRVAKNGYWGTWRIFKIRGEAGEDGVVPVVSFLSTVFRRSANYTESQVNGKTVRTLDPSENPTGGSYESPNPTNRDGNNQPLWSDGIPAGAGLLWVSTRKFYSDNQITSWRTPVPVGDTANMDFEWCDEEVPTYPYPTRTSPDDANPDYQWDGSSLVSDPSWYDEPNPNSDPVWLAMRPHDGARYTSANWQVMRVKGEKGDDGTSFVPKGQLFGVYNVATNTGKAAAKAYYDAHSSQMGTMKYAIVGTGLTKLYEYSSSYPNGRDVTSSLSIGDAYMNEGGDRPNNTPDLTGHIFIWDGDNFVDFGKIQGPEGKGTYLHIKYSNDGGQTFTMSGNVADGETPGDYIGTRVDHTPADSTNPADYQWKRWKGEDGFGYEYAFKLTNTDTPPSVPQDYPSYNKDGRVVTYQDDDYVPDGWTDDPGSPSRNNKYCWVIYRRKEHDVWQPFRGGAADSTRAALFAKWSSDGRGIESVTEMYAVATFKTLEGMTTTQIRNFKNTFTPTAPQFEHNLGKVYLWNYEIITYDDNTTQETDPEMIGMAVEGRGIASIEEFYYACDFGDPTVNNLSNYLPQWGANPASDWKLKPMNVSKDNPYLWNFERIGWTDGTVTFTQPVIIAYYVYTDIEYLKTLFRKVEGDANTAYIGGLLGVIDDNNKMQAMLNATNIGKDDEHGKLYIAAGLDGLDGTDAQKNRNAQKARFKVYEDGHVAMKSAEIQGYLTQHFRRVHDVENYLVEVGNGTQSRYLDKSKLSNAILLGWNTLSFSENGRTVDFSDNYEVTLSTYLGSSNAGRVLFSNQFYISSNGTMFSNNNYGKTLLDGYFILPNGTITEGHFGVALYGGWVEAIKISAIDEEMQLINPQLTSMDNLYLITGWGGSVRFAYMEDLPNVNANQAVVHNEAIGFNLDYTRRKTVGINPEVNVYRLTEFNKTILIKGDSDASPLYLIVPILKTDTWYDKQDIQVQYDILLNENHREIILKEEVPGANTPDAEVPNLPNMPTLRGGTLTINAHTEGASAYYGVGVRLTYINESGITTGRVWMAEQINQIDSL